MTEFFDAIRNPLTKDRYEKRLDLFFRHIKIDGDNLQIRARNFSSKAKKDTEWATFVINEYARFQRGRAENKEISESTIPNYFKPIRLFCEQNDISLNWKKIARRIPRGREAANDRAPTRDEIKTLIQYPDRRIRPVALFMASSGARLGAFDYLDWGNVKKLENKKGELLAAKVTIYAGTRDEYESFITPEAYHSIEEYMKFRQDQGEKVSKESPLIRDLFYPDRLGKGEPHIPKRLKSTGVKRLIEDALKGTGLRRPLESGKKRHEFQADHGFRKFFKSVAERHMKTLHVEMLMGHNVGLAENYYRPKETEILDDYIKAVPELTMVEIVRDASLNDDIESLKRRLEKLEAERKHDKAVLSKILSELKRR
ncbi:MAG: hypothetical protein JRN67_00980 [Nitrososphaerota archaeon]|nr:hypothetical protein [Nitrososphaerota archaeon]